MPNTQTSIRQNSTPQGGATNYITQGNGFVTLDIFSLKALNDRFTNSTKANLTTQGTTPLKAGQISDFQMQNVGFAQTYFLDFVFKVNFTNLQSGVIEVGKDFPYSFVPQIQHILNGNITTHSGSAYDLVSMYNRKYGNISNVSTYTYHQDTANFASFINHTDFNSFRQSKGGNLESFSILESTDIQFSVNSNTGILKSITGDNNSENGSMTIAFRVPIEHTVRKDNLIGLLPLQNNSVYSNVRIQCNNLGGDNGTFKNVFLFKGAGITATLDESSSYVQPTVRAYAVPDPSMVNTYAFLTSYNYYNLATSFQTQSTGNQAFQYKLSNNYMLMSLILTSKKTTNGDIVLAGDALDNVYVNYNNSYILDRISGSLRNYINSMGSTNSKNPMMDGQYLIDFADWNMSVNGENTSKYMNLYNANNLTLTGDVVADVPLDYSITAEYLVPTATNVLAG